MKGYNCTGNHGENRLSCYTPGILGSVWSQYLHCHQKRAPFSYIEGELQVGKVLRAFNLTQVHLLAKRGM